MIFELVFSCGVSNFTKDDFIGEYTSVLDLGGAVLELKQDQTFSYNLWGGFMNSKSPGTWKIEGSKILFKSYDDLKTSLIEVEALP